MATAIRTTKQRSSRLTTPVTTHDFIALHRNRGHVVEATAASIPTCWTCNQIYVAGRVLAFEPEPEPEPELEAR
jgi:hypothetical protein